MTKFRRKQRNLLGCGFMPKLFFAAALLVSSFFIALNNFIAEEPLRRETKILEKHFVLHNLKKTEIKHANSKVVSPKKDSTTSTGSSNEPNYHIVFSTDCSGYQKWQSYLLFYSAYKVKQPGTITRIASGCTEEEEQNEIKFQSDISKHMSSNFKLHLTPHFSKVKDENGQTTNKNYAYFNKPFGLLHWIEHSDEDIKDDDIIILLDPDQVLTRQITRDFSNQSENLLYGDNPKTIVAHGSPFAQNYGFGDAAWQSLDVGKVAGTEDTPAKKVGTQEAHNHYPAGPPYLATARDMHRIAEKWVEFVPRSHKEHPYLMAEMYAYCIAAAHLELPHQLVRSLMVSDVDAAQEGWELVNAIDDDKICSPTLMEDNVLPSVLHYCQRYILGKHFFGKHRMKKDLFSCESPLLLMPPEDIAEKYDEFIPPAGTHGETMKLQTSERKQYAFMLCILTRIVNEASLFYQSKNCETPKDTGIALDFWSLKTVQTRKK